MQQWYVLQVLSAHEKKVKKSLEENREAMNMLQEIGEVLLPTENVLEVKQGEQKVSEKRLWPGYLLVKMELTDDSWRYVKETNGVIDFLGGGAPTPLTDREVEAILMDLSNKGEQVTQRHKFNVGDRVKIVDGVFVNFLGVVTDVNLERGKMSVIVSIFGRDTQVDDLEFWQVEEASEEDEDEAAAGS